MKRYLRPLCQVGPARPKDAVTLAGGWAWFSHVEVIRRGTAPEVVPVAHLPDAELISLTTARTGMAGLRFDTPQIMGILNVTPDSFSDGGQHDDPARAVAQAGAMQAAAADLIDVGGESTRPGAATVPVAEEISRISPVIAQIRAAGLDVPISIDTRKTPVAQAAHEAGASLVNDVSGFTFDVDLAGYCAKASLPVCVMHAQGDPATMQDDPQYDDVLLDVYDWLAARIDALIAAGIPRAQIIADPGIGFGKTQAHNLALLTRLSLFHGLGVPILLGASRKGFIGRISGTQDPQDRMPGSIAVALAALGQGIQVLRVHDVAETRQAIALWQASMALNTP